MKSGLKLLCCCAGIAFLALLAGCVLRPTAVTTRQFVLSPAPTGDPISTGTSQLPVGPVGIGPVKMPPYLLRSSLAIRKGTNEVEYLESARWAERLDQSFRRTLAENLSRLLPAERIYPVDWGQAQWAAMISVEVQQFDVDAEGRGTLIAQWRLEVPGSGAPAKTGRIQELQTGPSPRGQPEAIAATMSTLEGKLSRELAQALVSPVKDTP